MIHSRPVATRGENPHGSANGAEHFVQLGRILDGAQAAGESNGTLRRRALVSPFARTNSTFFREFRPHRVGGAPVLQVRKSLFDWQGRQRPTGVDQQTWSGSSYLAGGPADPFHPVIVDRTAQTSGDSRRGSRPPSPTTGSRIQPAENADSWRIR